MPGEPAAVEAVETVVLTNLTATLKDPNLTDADLAAIALHWAALDGHIADDARHLIDKQFEFRQATRRAVTTGGAK